MRVQLVALATIVRKEVTRFLRIWTQALVPAVITTTLYFVIFGNLIGRRIGEMGGFAYIDFIIPGLILMSVITASYANVSSSFFSAKFQDFIEEILVSPTTNLVIIAGYVTGGVARGLCVGVLVTLVSLLFTELQVYNFMVLASTAFLTAVLFSLAGMINGIYARTFDDIALAPTFILTPLTYLGGVFYSIRLLPDFWQGASLANPILYMINAFRYGFLGVSDISLWSSYALIFGAIVFLAWFCLHLLNRGHGIRT